MLSEIFIVYNCQFENSIVFFTYVFPLFKFSKVLELRISNLQPILQILGFAYFGFMHAHHMIRRVTFLQILRTPGFVYANLLFDSNKGKYGIRNRVLDSHTGVRLENPQWGGVFISACLEKLLPNRIKTPP